jgi:DNA polymerase-3 subunit epsilon
MDAATQGTSAAYQPALADVGPSLRDETFVVVDLETTGTSARSGAGITEIGAVKVRGGAVLGEFSTLVNPGEPIPPFISVLTGITDAMVASSPRIASVLPAFLEFCGGPTTVLVAHNAPFDLGFLRAAAREHGITFPAFEVLDTVRLARAIIPRDEVRDCKLATLAKLFRSTTTPTHRALDDARATVDVLHGLMARLGNLGVHSLEDLKSFAGRTTAMQKRKRHLADHVPTGPGVYIFRDAKGEALYIGTSRNLRSRVKSYFTAAETRRRISEMLGYAERIDTIPCPTPLEAQVRELRLIAAGKPRYNRRSRQPERASWIRLTDETFPRLSLTREPQSIQGDEGWCGPFTSRGEAALAVEAIHEALPVRQCTPRITAKSQQRASACILLDLAKCGGPCIGLQTPDAYATFIGAAIDAMHVDVTVVTAPLRARMQRLALEERYEEAGALRDRIGAFVRATARGQRLRALTRIPHLLAARATQAGGWEFACIRYGRLAGTAVAGTSADARMTIEALEATAEQVRAGDGPTPAATYEETELLLRWLEEPGVRLVNLEGTWASPLTGAGREYRDLEQVLFHRESIAAPSEQVSTAMDAHPRSLVSRINLAG